MSGERTYGRPLPGDAGQQPLPEANTAREKTIDLDLQAEEKELPAEYMVSPPLCDESIDLLAAYLGFDKDNPLPEQQLASLLMRILVVLGICLAAWQLLSWLYSA